MVLLQNFLKNREKVFDFPQKTGKKSLKVISLLKSLLKFNYKIKFFYKFSQFIKMLETLFLKLPSNFDRFSDVQLSRLFFVALCFIRLSEQCIH